jgi:hypothetical protein
MPASRASLAKRFARCAWCAVACAALCAFAKTARAESTPELALTWEADPACPDRAWFEERLRDRLAEEIGDDRPRRPLVVNAYLRRAEAGFALDLATEQGGERGERHLTAPACAELAEAAVLVVALAVIEQAPEPEAPREPAPPRDTEVPPPQAPEAPAEKPTRRNLTLRADALLDVGSLPQLGFGPQLSVGYLGRNLRAELAGYWLPAQETQRSTGGNVSVSSWALRPVGCARLWGTTLRLDACAGLELGRIVGEGTDLNQERQRAWFHRAAVAGLRASLALDRLAAVLEPGLAAPLGRPRFVSDAGMGGVTRPLHTPASVAFRATLGVELRF